MPEKLPLFKLLVRRYKRFESKFNKTDLRALWDGEIESVQNANGVAPSDKKKALAEYSRAEPFIFRKSV